MARTFGWLFASFFSFAVWVVAPVIDVFSRCFAYVNRPLTNRRERFDLFARLAFNRNLAMSRFAH